MIKLGCNSLVKDRDNPGGWIDIETMIDLIHTLRLDIIDFQLDRGFRSLEPAYLRRVKILCHRYGLPIGFIGAGSGFVSTAQFSYRTGVWLARRYHRKNYSSESM